MSDFGVRKRIWNAIEHLATDSKPLRERALDAYCDYLDVLVPQEFDGKGRRLFEQLQGLVADNIAKAEQHPDPWNLELHAGPVEVTKKKIRDSTGKKIAELILRIYEEIEPDR